MFVSKVVRPIIATLNWTANVLLRAFGVQPKNEATSTYTLEEVASIVAQFQREGTLSDGFGALAGASSSPTRPVADVDLPLEEMVTLLARATPADVQRAVEQYGHSRCVITDATGEPTGYLHMKDVMDISGDAFDTPYLPSASAD